MNIKKGLSSFSLSDNKYVTSQRVFICSKSKLDNTETI